MAANGQTEAADSGRARSQDGVQGSQSDRACRNWRCRTDRGLRSPLVPSLSSIVSGVVAEVGIQLPSPEVKEERGPPPCASALTQRLGPWEARLGQLRS